MKRTYVVIGLGFGDEGKGITTDYLAKHHKKSLVVRFSGGQQAGHTVVNDDKGKHVFSNFGSGTLSGVPTYWSRYCTLSPQGIVNEYSALVKIGCYPKLYIDNLSMVTTPYDIAYNRTLETINKHGSCGMGFAATIQRSETMIYGLYAQDILLPSRLLKGKFNNISQYYEDMINILEKERGISCKEIYSNHLSENNPGQFSSQLQSLRSIITIVDESILRMYDTVVFEGSQGILLDMDYGFFPHVTRSNTISKNTLDLIERNGLQKPVIYYVTRAYATRHGNGPMTNEYYELSLKNNEQETNISNTWQGKLRVAPLDLNLIEYALQCDSNYTIGCKKNLVVTCLDQLTEQIVVTKDDKEIRTNSFKSLLNDGYIPALFNELIESYSPNNKDFISIVLWVILFLNH